MSKFEEYVSRALEILKSKDGAFFTVQGSRVDDNDLLGRIIAILKNKHGELNIPLDKIDALADAILPQLRAFFQSAEGRKEYSDWKKEQELKLNPKLAEGEAK